MQIRANMDRAIEIKSEQNLKPQPEHESNPYRPRLNIYFSREQEPVVSNKVATAIDLKERSSKKGLRKRRKKD